MREAARLTGVSYWTLRHWNKRGWVRTGSDCTLCAWQVVTLAVLAATDRGVGKGAYLGDISVRRAMESVADLDDALLLAESDQSLYMAEATAAIANSALPNEELLLSEELFDNLARVLAALDRKVRSMTRVR
jgi:hypothetical protein